MPYPQDSIRLRAGTGYRIPVIYGDVSYASLNPSLVTVTPDGLVTAVNPGKTYIQIRDPKNSDRSAYITVEVVSAGTAPYQLGNPNGDAAINANDATMILVAAARIGTNKPTGFTDEQRAAADVNSDSLVNAADATAILRYAAAAGTSNPGDILNYT